MGHQVSTAIAIAYCVGCPAMDIALRPLTTADIPVWAELLNACAVADGTGEHYTQDDLVEEMANPALDVALDTVAAEVGGRMVGYGQLIPRDTDGSVHKLIFDGMTHPDHRGHGVGTTVMTALHERALTIHAERYPGVERAWSVDVLADAPAAQALVESVGFVPERWSFDMRAVLADLDPAAVDVVGGLLVQTYDPALHDRAVFDAHNDAFLDHPGFSPWSSAMWQQWVTGSRSFRPGLSVIAIDPDEPEVVQAYVQSAEYDGTTDVTGRRELWVAKVGTRQAHRGKGVAGALLAHVLAAAKAEGYDDAGLDVDSENPTGALGVYERVGFGVTRRWVNCFLRGV